MGCNVCVLRPCRATQLGLAAPSSLVGSAKRTTPSLTWAPEKAAHKVGAQRVLVLSPGRYVSCGTSKRGQSDKDPMLTF